MKLASDTGLYSLDLLFMLRAVSRLGLAYFAVEGGKVAVARDGRETKGGVGL